MAVKNSAETGGEPAVTLNVDEWRAIQTALSAPFPEDEVGQVPIDRSGKLLGKYITARAVMDRLDAVVGPGNWSDEYEMWDGETCAVKCTITVFGVKRSDVGYPNDPSDADNAKREPLKAACSDALKRAAVHWGIGRYLYPKPGERGISPDATARVSRPATEKQVRFLRDLAGNYNLSLPESLDGLPMDVARKWIDELQAKGPNAELTGWTGGPSPLSSTEAGAHDGDYSERPVQRRESEGQRAPSAAATAERSASVNQLAAIIKLSRLLGRPEEPPQTMTAAEASERITELSREYNERRPSALRQTA